MTNAASNKTRTSRGLPVVQELGMSELRPGTQGTPLWCWINPDSFRYCQVCLVLDLFGDWTLVCAWGGLGSRRGSYRVTGVLSYDNGVQRIGEMDAHRQKRGYVPVSTLADWADQIAQMRGTACGPRPKPPQPKPEATVNLGLLD